MKTLTLLRHAKSDVDDPSTRDVDRILNAKGQRAARLMGERMASLDLGFERVVASPAMRVAQTLDHVGQGFGRALAPAIDRRIYLASAATLLDLVREQDDDVATLLLVGHNPGLEDLVLMLVPDRSDDRLRDDVEVKFPTASLAELQFDAASWGEVAPSTATLTRFIRPRDLDPSLGPDAV